MLSAESGELSAWCLVDPSGVRFHFGRQCEAVGSPRRHTLMSMIFWMEYAPISMDTTAPMDILIPIGSFHSISM